MKRKYILAIVAGVLTFAAAVAVAREYVASHVFRPTANDRGLGRQHRSHKPKSPHGPHSAE